MTNAVSSKSIYSNTPWKGKLPGQNEFNTLLNLFDKPALLVDSHRLQIISINSELIKLSTIAAADLIGNHINRLFQQLDTDNLLPGTELPLKLLCNKDEVIEVISQISALDLSSQWLLITLTPISSFDNEKNQFEQQTRFSQALDDLNMVFEQSDLSSALYFLLDIAKRITGADVLCIYMASSQYPRLQKVASLTTAPEIDFPDTLASSNLIRLHEPNLWIPGKRVTTDIHRHSRISDLNYSATIPIGQEGAWSGLLVLGSKKDSPSQNTMDILRILAAYIAICQQYYLHTNNLQLFVQEQKTRLSIHDAIFDNAQEGLILAKPDLTISEMNQSAELMLGYACTEVENEKVDNILIGTETLDSPLRSALQGIPTHNLGNISLHRRNGQSFLAHIEIVPIIENANLISVLIILRDVSENEQIRVRTQQLEQRALLGEVTAIFAHEVRNPINNISTALQLFDLNLSPADPNKDLVGKLQQDCSRLTHLMESVLTFSRTMEYKMEPVNLDQLLQRILDRWRPRFMRNNIQPYFQINCDRALVKGDPRALEQVFTNLISNATQAMDEEGGTLAIKVSDMITNSEYPQLEITISDSGPGIPDNIRDRIFEPFFTTNPQGTGLGLAITKRIITAHKGTIFVNSFPGGTVFYIHLPTLAKEVLE